MKWIASLCVFAALGLTQLGCSSTPRGAPAPRVTVQNVLATSSSTPQRFRVSLQIDNQGSEPLSIRQIDFKLRLANEGIIDGRGIGPVNVAALDRQTLAVDLSSDLISSLSRLLSFVEGPGNTLPYEIYGTLTFGPRLGDTLTFSTSGRVPLSMTSDQ